MSERNLQSVAFPTLDETQVEQLGRCTNAAPRLFRDGQTLFAVGDRDMSFFIVKSGEVEIVDYSGDEPKTVTIHRKGAFTGDISHLTGLPAIVSGIARGDCEVYEVSGDALRARPQPVPGHQRYHSSGVHCAAAASARVPQLHRPAGDRVPLLPGHVPRS